MLHHGNNTCFYGLPKNMEWRTYYMNHSSDFMYYVHEDKIQRLRHDKQLGHGYKRNPLAGELIESPFARVRNAVSTLIGVRGIDNHHS